MPFTHSSDISEKQVPLVPLCKTGSGQSVAQGRGTQRKSHWVRIRARKGDRGRSHPPRSSWVSWPARGGRAGSAHWPRSSQMPATPTPAARPGLSCERSRSPAPARRHWAADMSVNPPAQCAASRRSRRGGGARRVVTRGCAAPPPAVGRATHCARGSAPCRRRRGAARGGRTRWRAAGGGRRGRAGGGSPSRPERVRRPRSGHVPARAPPPAWCETRAPRPALAVPPRPEQLGRCTAPRPGGE